MRELLRPNMWGQISFCRKNVFTMIFVVDPGTEDGLAALGYMGGLYQQGAPIRFGVVLAPGASRGAIAARRASPLEPGAASRLKALRRTYDADWEADKQLAPLVSRADAAPSALGDGGAAGDEGGEVAEAEVDEAAEAQAALGLLLTKLFIFCKRKAGNAVAMMFLALTQEVREVGGFFGSHTEPLTEGHLEQAFNHALQRKKIDAKPIFDGLKAGTLADYDADAAAGLGFLQDKGLGDTPALLMNGVLTPLTQGLEHEVMNALNAEVRSVTALVRQRKITDETSDVYSAIANHSATFPRYNKDLLISQEKVRRPAAPRPAAPRVEASSPGLQGAPGHRWQRARAGRVGVGGGGACGA